MTSLSRGRRSGLALLAGGSLLFAAVPLSAAPLSEVEAIEAALAQGDFAALGEAERAAAEARVRAIPRFDNPQANISRESVSGSAGRETEWQAGVEQPIDISGRRGSLRAAARAEATAVTADVARRRQERIAEVREAYAGCAAAGDKVAIAERFASRLKEAERIVNLRTKAGDTAGYDLRRLRASTRSAEAELRIVQGELGAECVALSRLTGVSDARPAIPLASLVPPSPAAAGTGPTNRQDLAAREARVAAATAEVSAAQRSRLPELNVGLGYKRISNEAGSAGGPTVGLGVRLPIFNSGGATVDEARARQRVREAELALARREVEASIAAARARSAAATAAAMEARQAADDAQRLGTIAETAYEGGETGIIELVDAYRTARDAERNIVDLTERAVRATIAQSLAEGRER
jgi:outer membrane protein, heavy metal efflux system